MVSTQKLQEEIQKLLECIEGTAAVHASRRVMKREKVEVAAPPLRQRGIRTQLVEKWKSCLVKWKSCLEKWKSCLEKWKSWRNGKAV